MDKATFDQNLTRLEAEMKQLEAEYNMYFAGRRTTPPWEIRDRVAALVKQYDRAHIQNTGDRFRFQTLQARFVKFVDLWDRGLRAREEGRPGPFGHARRKDTGKKPAEDKLVHVTAFRDPTREVDKLTELYESLAEARREAGEEQVSFKKFAEVVKGQVKKLRESGNAEVAFRVSVKNGKVNFTAKALKGGKASNG